VTHMGEMVLANASTVARELDATLAEDGLSVSI
jgi:hypothetical protein